jgi:hypothetical protein
MAKVRGLVRRISRTVFPPQQRQQCHPSISRLRDIGRTHIILLHLVTSHRLMVTLMATGSRRTNPLIIQFTLVTPQWLYILRIQVLTALSPPRPARRPPNRPPRSKRLTTRW